MFGKNKIAIANIKTCNDKNLPQMEITYIRKKREEKKYLYPLHMSSFIISDIYSGVDCISTPVLGLTNILFADYEKLSGYGTASEYTNKEIAEEIIYTMAVRCLREFEHNYNVRIEEIFDYKMVNVNGKQMFIDPIKEWIVKEVVPYIENARNN